MLVDEDDVVVGGLLMDENWEVVETLEEEGVIVVTVDVLLDDVAEDVLDVDGEIVDASLNERYQLVSASPKHEPTVTPFHPLALIWSK